MSAEKPQQEAFDKLKSVINSALVLAYFDNRKETVLSVDASSTGFGAVTMQEGKPVAFSSQTLTASEKLYANYIERGLLAMCAICVGSAKASHVCVRVQSYCKDRPQTARIDLSETTYRCPSPTTGDAVETHQV